MNPTVPTTCEQTSECLVFLWIQWKVWERSFYFVCVCVWAYFILAWLIRMPLAGSCPNRGCHLIKSIICWLNLLELRRKRSVHTLSRPVCLCVPDSPTHSPLSKGGESFHRNPWLIQANPRAPPNHNSSLRRPVWRNLNAGLTWPVVIYSICFFQWGFTNELFECMSDKYASAAAIVKLFSCIHESASVKGGVAQNVIILKFLRYFS